jgi:RNA polymerase sigma-70 factor (ECF subfamily)
MIQSEPFPAVPALFRQSNPVSAPVDSDAALLVAARSMNREALAKIFDLHSRRLYNYALRLCHDPLTADHVVGDVFAKFLDQLSLGHGPLTNLRAYLYEIAYHLIVDEVRYSQRIFALECMDAYQWDEFSFQSLENRLTFEKVMHAIQTALTKDQQHVIVLRFLEGMSLQETAAIVGKSVNHVKVIQNRAIDSLRKALDGR